MNVLDSHSPEVKESRKHVVFMWDVEDLSLPIIIFLRLGRLTLLLITEVIRQYNNKSRKIFCQLYKFCRYINIGKLTLS